MRYAIVIERGRRNYSAFAPDVPGCITTGKTVEEIKRNFVEALTGHFEVMREHDEPIPEPTTVVDYVEVDVPEPTAATTQKAKQA